MKINIIGTGTMGSVTRGNQSILVEDILFDVGSGVVKQMERQGLQTKDINYLFITHSHADHFVDLPNFLIGRGIRGENQKLLHIICGKGIREKAIQLFYLTFGDGISDKYANFEEKFNVEFVELEDKEVYEDKNLNVTAYELEHGTCKPMLGFILEKDGHKIGYATDTVIGPNVREICKQSEYAFLDANNPIASRMHMGMQDLLNPNKEFPETEIYAIHRGDYEHGNIKEIKFPNDGDVIEI